MMKDQQTKNVSLCRVHKSNVRRKIDFEDEEERRIKEGAETLLNLAGITTRKRSNSEREALSATNHIKHFKEEYEKPSHFRPRLLRSKRKDTKQKAGNLTNNNNDDEWVKHRRELEINQQR